MKYLSLLVCILLSFALSNCGGSNESGSNLFTVKINNPQKAYKVEDVLSVSVINKKNKDVDSVVLYLDEQRLTPTGTNLKASVALVGQKLGSRRLKAKVYLEGQELEASKQVIILSSVTPQIYTYEILESYPHDMEAYTQGLEFYQDTLYESTGQYKSSSLRKTDLTTGAVLENIPLQDQYFGEGLTILNDKIYQLTWRENVGFIYQVSDLSRTGTFVYNQSKEGWGLCNNGSTIYKSDGTERIWTLNPTTLAEEGYIEIYTNTSRIKSVNELEWVEGKIYANRYEKDAIAIVNPSNGAVEGVIDLKGLRDQVTQHDKLDVLNGIAYRGEKDILYVTGKNWDKLFKIRVIPRS